MPLNHTQIDDLQKDLADAFGLLQDKHPVIKFALTSYLHDRPMDDFDLFSSTSFSKYFKEHGDILNELLNKNEMDYFKQQLKYYKALVLIMGLIAEDPTIMDNKQSEKLQNITHLCLKNTAELRELLSDAIKAKISPRISPSI